MRKIFLIPGLFITCFWIRAQDVKPVEKQADSVQQVLAEEGVDFEEVEMAPINPLAPSKAGLTHSGKFMILFGRSARPRTDLQQKVLEGTNRLGSYRYWGIRLSLQR